MGARVIIMHIMHAKIKERLRTTYCVHCERVLKNLKGAKRYLSIKGIVSDMNIGNKVPEKVILSIEIAKTSFLPNLKNFCHIVEWVKYIPKIVFMFYG